MKIFSHVLFLLCLPAFLLSPIPSSAFYSEPARSPYEGNQGKHFDIPRDKLGRVNPWVLFQPERLSIDRYFAFIDLTENEVFLESLTEEEFDIVVDFVTHMVQASIPESLEDLKDAYELEIEQLMEDLYGEPKWSFSLSHGFDFEIIPAICFQKPEFFLCNNWFKQKAHHFGHWCKKHKKPLIAGAVVVGVVTVAVLTGGVGGSSAAAVGGGIINDTYSEDPPKHINKPGEVYVDDGPQHPAPPDFYSSISEHPSISPSEPTLLEQTKALSFERVEEVKLEIAEATQNIIEVPEDTYVQKSKDVTKTAVSNIVHDVFESVSKIGTCWHDLHSNSTPEDIQAYKEYVAEQHAKIDEIFGTYRPDYSLESQEYSEAFKAAIIEELGHYPEMQIGELPPPGVLINAASRAATVASRAIGIAARSGSAIGSAAAVGSMINWESPIQPTSVNDTIGWKVGDPINNRTLRSEVPTWSAVRHRYWRNEALNVKNGVTTKALEQECYDPTEENLTRMEKGLAPQSFSEKSGKMESIELHHDPAQRDGGLFDVTPMTPEMHAQQDPLRHTGN